MLFEGITLVDGAELQNLIVESGTTFPTQPIEGQMFYRTDPPNQALYIYDGSTWLELQDQGNGSIKWTTPRNLNLVGDVTGTFANVDGTNDVTATITLPTINGNIGTYGAASNTIIVTVNAKGQVVSIGETPIAISAAQVTSGVLPDARVQQSNVTQHQASLVISETQLDDGTILSRNAGNETITGTWTFNNAVTGQDPTVASHLATKQYVDNTTTGLDFKQSVRVSTTTNIALSSTQNVDGVSLSVGDRVLVKNQTDGVENGIYVVAAGAWSRSVDADNTPGIEITSGMYCFVEEGTVNANSGWVLSTDGTIILGTTPLVFAQFTGLGQVVAGDGLSKTGTVISAQSANSARIAVGPGGIDLAGVTNSGTGSFQKVNVDGYGRVVGTAAVAQADVIAGLGYTPVNKAGDVMSGDLTVSRLYSTSLCHLNGATNTYTGFVSGLTLNYIGNGAQFGIALKPTNNTGVTQPISFLSSTSTYAAGAAVAGIQQINDTSMNLLGIWTAGTQTTSDNSTRLATTAFVKNAITAGGGGAGGTWSTPRNLSFTGDATGTLSSVDGSADVSAPLTLATVNSNVGTFGSSTAVPVLSVNGKGLVTAVSTAALGTMAAQNSNLVNITGGNIANTVLLNALEQAIVVASPPNVTQDINVSTTSLWYFTPAATQSYALNVRGNASITLNTFLAVGQSITIAVLVTNGATPYALSSIRIDTIDQTVKWLGGVAPVTDANSVSAYSISIIKTASNVYTVLGSKSKFA